MSEVSTVQCNVSVLSSFEHYLRLIHHLYLRKLAQNFIISLSAFVIKKTINIVQEVFQITKSMFCKWN